MNQQSETTEADIQASLSDFYCRFKGVRLYVGDDYLNYKTGGGEHSNACALDDAKKIIRDFNLKLKAEIKGFPIKNILHVSKK